MIDDFQASQLENCFEFLVKYNWLCGNFQSDDYEAKMNKKEIVQEENSKPYTVKGKDGKVKNVKINEETTKANTNKIK